jgi:diguanylate cyclase (GGDEF)-like protein
LLALTNEYHHLIWRSFGEIDPVTNLMIFFAGDLYAFGVFYQILLAIIILILLFQQWLKFRQRSFRLQIEIIAIAIILPFIGVYIYLSEFNPLPGMDWAPIGSLFSVILITLSITTSRFLNLIPVARDLVFNLIHDGIMVVDSQFRVVDWNPALLEMIPDLPIQTGTSANQVFNFLGISNNPFTSLDDVINLETEVNEPEKRIIDVIISPLIRNDISDGWLVIFDDETERRMVSRALEKANLSLMHQLDEINKLKELLEEQAIRDPLTGLFNRRFFDEYFKNELIKSVREEKPISLLMVDIDHFKSVNDRFGHEVGDKVLQLLAEILKSLFRKSDVACRFGGEEFLVLLPGLYQDQANNRAEVLRETFEKATLEADFLYSQVTVSIGVSNYPLFGESTRDIFRTADRALYRAKEEGRNRVYCYHNELDK